MRRPEPVLKHQTTFSDLTIKLFADTSDLANMQKYAVMAHGFTTNPSLMRQARVSDYELFGRQVVGMFPRHPISFEVTTDDEDGMYRQARCISGWGSNVYVKIPVSTTDGTFNGALIHRLVAEGIKVNVTAIFTVAQVMATLHSVQGVPTPVVISIFVGRLADVGMDPCSTIKEAVLQARLLCPHVEILWASTREVFNVVQANTWDVDIITCTPAILDRLHLLGRDPNLYSLETVKQFYQDGLAAGLTLPI
jgi:transaldolase